MSHMRRGKVPLPTKGNQSKQIVGFVMTGRKDYFQAAVDDLDPAVVVEGLENWARSPQGGDGSIDLTKFWGRLSLWVTEALQADQPDELLISSILNLVEVLWSQFKDSEVHRRRVTSSKGRSLEYRGRQSTYLKRFCEVFFEANFSPARQGGLLTATGEPNQKFFASSARGDKIKKVVLSILNYGNDLWSYLCRRELFEGSEVDPGAREARSPEDPQSPGDYELLDRQETFRFGVYVVKVCIFLAFYNKEMVVTAAQKLHELESVVGTRRLWQLLNEAQVTSLLSWAMTKTEFMTNEKFLPSILLLGPEATEWFRQTLFQRIPYIKEDIARAWGRSCAKIFQFRKLQQPLRDSRQILEEALRTLVELCLRGHWRRGPAGLPIPETSYHFLSAFHNSLYRTKQNAELCYKLYDREIWSALAYPNSSCRLSAIRLFVEIYPLEMPTRITTGRLNPGELDTDDDEDAPSRVCSPSNDGVGAEKRRRFESTSGRGPESRGISVGPADGYHPPMERCAYVLKQVKYLLDAINDDDEACRVAACEGACKILGLLMEASDEKILKRDDGARIMEAVDTIRKMSSPHARAAIIRCYVALLSNETALHYAMPCIEDIYVSELLGEGPLPSTPEVKDAAAFLACKAFEVVPMPMEHLISLFAILGELPYDRRRNVATLILMMLRFETQEPLVKMDAVRGFMDIDVECGIRLFAWSKMDVEQTASFLQLICGMLRFIVRRWRQKRLHAAQSQNEGRRTRRSSSSSPGSSGAEDEELETDEYASGGGTEESGEETVDDDEVALYADYDKPEVLKGLLEVASLAWAARRNQFMATARTKELHSKLVQDYGSCLPRLISADKDRVFESSVLFLGSIAPLRRAKFLEGRVFKALRSFELVEANPEAAQCTQKAPVDCFRGYLYAAIQWNRSTELLNLIRSWMKGALTAKPHNIAEDGSDGEVAENGALTGDFCDDQPQRRSRRNGSAKKVRFQDQETQPLEKAFSLGRLGARYLRTLIETPNLRKVLFIKNKGLLEKCWSFLARTTRRELENRLKTPMLAAWKPRDLFLGEQLEIYFSLSVALTDQRPPKELFPLMNRKFVPSNDDEPLKSVHGMIDYIRRDHLPRMDLTLAPPARPSRPSTRSGGGGGGGRSSGRHKNHRPASRSSSSETPEEFAGGAECIVENVQFAGWLVRTALWYGAEFVALAKYDTQLLTQVEDFAYDVVRSTTARQDYRVLEAVIKVCWAVSWLAGCMTPQNCMVFMEEHLCRIFGPAVECLIRNEVQASEESEMVRMCLRLLQDAETRYSRAVGPPTATAAAAAADDRNDGQNQAPREDPFPQSRNLVVEIAPRFRRRLESPQQDGGADGWEGYGNYLHDNFDFSSVDNIDMLELDLFQNDGNEGGDGEKENEHEHEEGEHEEGEQA